jgi:integrase
VPRVSGIDLRPRPHVRGAPGERVPGVQGHRQGRNEESGVTWSVWPSSSYLRIEERVLEAGGLNWAGRSLPFHMLRHTAISLMCRAGYRPEWVAERVGHTDGGALILKRFRHLYPSESYASAPSLDALVAER